MKPSFALNFTDDGIQLLHRAGKGWTLVGETPFAAPDLDDALDYLRKTALGLEPGGFTTKLVIPNSQIRYLEIEAPGPDDAARRAQIAAVLEATTPLKADEIAFDWSGKGKTVKVAALDKATLAEAEGFAQAHRFNPVGFVAIPEEGAFSGEPFFGETTGAAALLKGDTVERDRTAIRIQSRDLPGARAATAVAPAGAAKEQAVAADAARAVEPPPEPEPEPAPEPTPPPAPIEAPVENPIETPVETPVEVPAPPAETGPADPLPEIPFPEGSAPAAEPSKASPPTTPSAPPQDASPMVPEAADEAPFTHVPENPAFPEDEPELARPATARAAAPPAATVDDDLPPPPSAAAMLAFASRRAGDAPGAAPALGAASRPDPAALARAARGKPVEDLPPMPRPPQAGARPAAPSGLRAGMSKGLGALVTAPSLPGSRKAKVKTTPPQPAPSAAARVQTAAATPTDAARSLTRPGGTFGARPAAPTRTRTILFLSLVAILLLCLAMVAAWSSLYLSGRSDPAAQPEAVAQGTEAEVPAIEDEMLADGEDPGEAALPAAEDIVSSEAATENLAVAEEAAIEEPVAPAPGVASDNPETQSLPQQPDEIFLATSDPPPPALDALSLPAPDGAADALPAPQMPPPPFGTVYAFDANGLLIPTPEGIVSPEGVLLIAGKPPLVPPSRSEAATAAAAEAAAQAAAPADGTAPALVEALPVGIDPAAPGTAAAGIAAVPADAGTETAATEPAAQPDPDLADRRPRARPDGLAPDPEDAAADDAALSTDPEVTFVSLRPRERPQVILAASERARSETEGASLVTASAAPAPSEAAEAEAALAAAAAAEAANPSVVAISRRPAPRPGDFSAAVEAAVAAAIRAPEPKPEPEPEPEPAPKKSAKKEPAPDLKPEEQDEIDEPEVAAGPAPKIPTKANVAKQATFKNAINLSKINLIGVYGTQSKRYALIRQANGKYKKVKVGDRIDGGRVEAITQNEVRYQKGGRLISLKMPKG
jgi:hypothetical protein